MPIENERQEQNYTISTLFGCLPKQISEKKNAYLMKTRKRALTRANKTILNLESEISVLKRNISTRNKQIEHLRKKGLTSSTSSNTPQRQTEKYI